ncbi:MAG: sulfatase [Verrucomicrobiales bacterium]|nr:sulfatase [Verrucomicrobiales bacterium]
MKHLLPFLLLAPWHLLLAAEGRPNVLFVISDDLNYAMSGLGHPDCKTPNLDAFAKSTVSFTHAYCQFPLCGPSRASIMSGQYPATSGVTSNGGSVPENRVTLPKHFQNHGYWTARVSKIYHMGIPVDIVQGTSGKDHPPSWNQTHNIAALETMTPGKAEDFTNAKAVLSFPEDRQRWHQAQQSGTPYQMPRTVRGHYAVVEVADKDTGLLADTMATDKAIEILQDRAGKDDPFFLAVGLVRPHFPFVSTDSTIAPYDAGKLQYPHFPADDYDDIPPQAINARMRFPEAPVRKLRRGYFGAVTYMDQQFGRLLAELDHLDLRQNTIVVFVSDHGYLLGEHQMWKKTKLWEDAIHVPLFISAPGVPGGKTCHRLVELVDLYPTLAELAGLPADPGAQGLSLAPLLRDPTAQRPSKPDALIQIGAGHCLRTERWAYMWYPAKKKNPEAFMLFDMQNDPGQFTNLASHPDHAPTRTRLHQHLTERVAQSQPATAGDAR